MLRFFWLSGYELLRRYLERQRIYPRIYNANGLDETGLKKRALLIYIVRPFLPGSDGSIHLRHQNKKQCKQIAHILGELGYIVDVVDLRDRRFQPSKDYDLIVSHRSDLQRSFGGSKTTKIFLATTTNPVIHNRNLKRRHQRLHERRGVHLQLRRMYPEKFSYLEHADAIVGFGNEHIMSTWTQSFPIPAYAFNNYGFPGTKLVNDSKDFSAARKNFLFFASGSQMQKGLDLLLEIFPKHPELHLYICGGFIDEQDFCESYHKELYETANIHPVGWVQVNSEKFYDLVRSCACVIHPTCSEGQPGSVVQCMYTGLIPLVTREAGIDVEDFGIRFADDSLEEIERLILDVSEQPASWHQNRSIKTRKVAESNYSEEAFLKRWEELLRTILYHRREMETNQSARIECI